MSRVAMLAFTVLLGSGLAAGSVRAAEGTAEFMARFAGGWLGSGQLLVGPSSGLEFHCELTGKPSRTQLTFAMTGKCWMGGLSAPVHGSLRYNAETDRFYGEFMDGADGNGVDVVGARANDDLSLQLSRESVQGRLAAEPVNANQITVTMFLKDPASERELPVVAMGFTRKEASAMGLPNYLPDVQTGSIPAK